MMSGEYVSFIPLERNRNSIGSMDPSEHGTSQPPSATDLVSPSPEKLHEEKARPLQHWNRLDWLLVLVLVGLILFYFRSLIFSERYIYGELDIRRSIYLFRTYAYQLLREGRMPLWMPFIYCGMPLLGSFLATPFYPLDLLFAIARAPYTVSFNWDLLIHLVAAQVFSYLFFKRLLKSRMGAVFCSLWFWNAFFLNSIAIGDALNIRAMLLVPVVFYFIDSALSPDGRPRHLLLVAAAFAFQILSGGVQFAFYTLVAGTGYSFFLLSTHSDPVKRRVLLACGYVCAVGLAFEVAAVQLIPQWEYSRLSVRADGIEWFRVWAVQLSQLVDYVFPYVTGERLGYFGIIPLILATFSLVFWKDKRKYFFLGLGLISLIYSLGGNTKVSSLIAGLPFVRDFRGPFRGALFFNFSVYALAGGAFVMSLGSIRRSVNRTRFLFLLIASAVVLGLVTGGIAVHSSLRPQASIWWISAVLAALCLPAAYLLFFSRRLKKLSGTFLIILLLFDLALQYKGFLSPVPADTLFAEDSTARYLLEKEPNSRIIVLNTADANYFALFGIESANGHHPFPLSRYAQFLPLLNDEKIASLSGVKYRVIYSQDVRGRPYNPPVSDPSQVSLRPVSLEPMRRAFLVSRYTVKGEPAEALAAMQNNFDPAGEVILDRRPDAEPKAGQSPGEAEIVGRTPDSVTIQTKSNGDAILVLTDSFYPGWQARVDGEEVDTLRADSVFRAVSVPSGEHTVDFKFRPMSFVLGAGISCLGLATWVVAFLLMKSRFRLIRKPASLAR